MLILYPVTLLNSHIVLGFCFFLLLSLVIFLLRILWQCLFFWICVCVFFINWIKALGHCMFLCYTKSGGLIYILCRSSASISTVTWLSVMFKNTPFCFCLFLFLFPERTNSQCIYLHVETPVFPWSAMHLIYLEQFLFIYNFKRTVSQYRLKLGFN